MGHRFEERKANDVIQMGMGENDTILESIFPQQLISQPPNSGTCIHDNDLIILGSNL
jgi:hypothetical protein